MTFRVEAILDPLPEVCVRNQLQSTLRLEEADLKRFFAWPKFPARAARAEQYIDDAFAERLKHAAKCKVRYLYSRFLENFAPCGGFERFPEFDLTTRHFPPTARRAHQQYAASCVCGDDRRA